MKKLSSRCVPGAWKVNDSTVAFVENSGALGQLYSINTTTWHSQKLRDVPWIIEHITPIADWLLFTERDRDSMFLVLRTREFDEIARRPWRRCVVSSVYLPQTNSLLVATCERFYPEIPLEFEVLSLPTLASFELNPPMLSNAFERDRPSLGFLWIEGEVWRGDDVGLSSLKIPRQTRPVIPLLSKQVLVARSVGGYAIFAGREPNLEILHLSTRQQCVLPIGTQVAIKEVLSLDLWDHGGKLSVTAVFRERHSSTSHCGQWLLNHSPCAPQTASIVF